MRVSKLSLKVVFISVVLAGIWIGASALRTILLTAPTSKNIAGAAAKNAQKTVAEQSIHIKRSQTPIAALPADTVWTFQDNGGLNTYAVALDELYVPSGAVSQRIHRLAPQPNLAALLAVAAGLTAQTGTQPQLVLYPISGPHDQFSRRIVTMKVQVETHDLATVKTAAASIGLSSWQVPSYAPNYAIAKVDGDPAAPLRAIASLANLSSVKSATPLLARQLSKLTLAQPTDLLFPQQWHLKNLGQQGGVKGVDINVTSVWPALNGTGMNIGIVDDGIQLNHPDLVANVAATGHHNWNSGDPGDPSPNIANGDFHGTSVAGLAAARDNGIGVVGVAPEATLYGLRLISEPSTDEQQAEAMAWENNVIQIKNNSWGPELSGLANASDPADRLYYAGSLWQSAVTDGTINGRGGLGTVYVFAAGNGQSNGDQGSKNAFASDIHVIAAGAITNKGASASFSEGGPHLVTSAPGDAATGIITTDLTGNNGYNDGNEAYQLPDTNYTDAFAGTSAAAPIVSGVIALMLEANPTLGWRDVKEILLRSSKQIQSTDTNWVTRDGGRPDLPAIKHHPLYGGGLINAQAATALARNWTNLGTETVLTTTTSASQNIPDGGDAILIPIDLNSATTLRVEHVELTLNITHPYRGDLEIKLISPGGIVSTFASPTLADAGADYTNWTFTSVRHWGEISRGPWILSIRDAAVSYAGQFISATLRVHGVVLPTPGVNAPVVFSTRIGSTVNLPLVSDGGNYTYRYTGLPKGLSYDTTTGVINGRTKTTGTYPLVLTITNANGGATTLHISLVVNPLPFSLLGSYSGWVDRDASLNQNLGGLLSLTTTTSGSFTGTLSLGNSNYAFKGSLDGNAGDPATVTVQIPRSGQSAVLLQFTIPVDNSGVTISGTLNNTTPITIFHQGFTTFKYSSRYTFALETPAGSGWPAGYTTGTVIATAAGTATWTLQPADGTATLKGSTTLSADGSLPLFALNKNPVSSFLGTLTLLPYTTPNAHMGGTVSWLRGATTSPAYANASGFGPLAMTIHGGRYSPPPAGTIILDLPAIANNANLSFGGTDVNLGVQAGTLDPFNITVDTHNKAIIPKPSIHNPVGLTINLNTVTGEFNGTFTLTDPNPANSSKTIKRNEKFSGIFLLPDVLGAGSFIVPSLPGSGNGTRSGFVVFVLPP